MNNELTIVQKEFLKVLESFMHDKKYQLPEELDEIKELARMAGQHKMMAAVYEQIRSGEIWKKEEYRDIFAGWKHMAIREVMLQVQRAEGFLTVYEKICAAGLRPLVVKGAICRNLYSKSDYRVSGDEDMLLQKEEFIKCDEILLHEGFQREELDLDNLPYEIPYIQPQNGVYIEMHFSLFSEESGAYGHLNEEFQNVFQNAVCEKIQGRDVWTLCPTEHLFYLVCHSFKHFLHGGFGMRQLCDMVMMAEHYGEKIDWNFIDDVLQKLHMKIYWNALVKIGRDFLGFDLEKAAYFVLAEDMEVDYVPMLNDLLDSGIYGSSTMERKHSSNMTLAAAANGKANTTVSLSASLFPNVSYMKKSFSWLEKYPWLLPVAYVIRIVRYLKNLKKKGKDEQNSVQIGMERVELLKKYDIIEK